MRAHQMVEVELAYASLDRQVLLTVQVAPGSTVKAVIEQSGVLSLFPELAKNADWLVGLFSQRVTLMHEVQAGDRIEIYRPLIVDPKKARQSRAKN